MQDKYEARGCSYLQCKFTIYKGWFLWQQKRFLFFSHRHTPQRNYSAIEFRKICLAYSKYFFFFGDMPKVVRDQLLICHFKHFLGCICNCVFLLLFCIPKETFRNTARAFDYSTPAEVRKSH